MFMRSRGELKIDEILTENQIRFTSEKSFDDLRGDTGVLLRFDFCVYDDDGEIAALIEFQGIQHYVAKTKFGGIRGLKKQQHNDNKKRRYCQAKGLKLIEIPYTEEAIMNYDYLYNRIYD